MNKSEDGGVQCEAFIAPGDFLQQIGSIAGITEHGVSGFCEVDTDLVASSGFEADLESGDSGGAVGIGGSVEQFPVGDGDFAFVGVSGRESSEVFAGCEEATDCTGGVIESSGCECFVAAIGGVLCELLAE